MRASAALVSVYAALVCLAGCGAGGGEVCLPETDRVATGWAPAEQLFRGDPDWVGGDAASSIDLGGGRVLWLFGDSFISRSGDGSRSGARFARNTIAIQSGTDPASATVRFHFRRDASGAASAFFAPDVPDAWLWPGHGARLDGVLLVFLWRMRATSDGGAFGFASDAPLAVLVENPDDEPDAWRMRTVAVPENPWGVFLGTGAVVVEGGFVHAVSCVEPGNHDVFLARWPIDEAARGELGDPEWFVGGAAWTRQSALASPPARLFEGGHTELSVFFDAASSTYVEIQASGFPGDVMMRTAPALVGPWSEPRAVYHPPELECDGVFTYAGKAHPELTSPDLAGRIALSYASNGDLAQVVRDESLYFPRFVRLDVARGIASP